MEGEILKKLKDITNRRVLPVTAKVVIMEFEDGHEFKMSKEQFIMFREWLISQGFIEIERNFSGMSIPLLKDLLIQLGYTVTIDRRRRGLIYVNDRGTKAVFVTYALDDAVTIYGITYFEKS